MSYLKLNSITIVVLIMDSVKRLVIAVLNNKFLVISTVVLLIAILFRISVANNLENKERKIWNNYKDFAECVIVMDSVMSLESGGEVVSVIHADGSNPTEYLIEAGLVGWYCSDGMLYWKPVDY